MRTQPDDMGGAGVVHRCGNRHSLRRVRRCHIGIDLRLCRRLDRRIDHESYGHHARFAVHNNEVITIKYDMSFLYLAQGDHSNATFFIKRCFF